MVILMDFQKGFLTLMAKYWDFPRDFQMAIPKPMARLTDFQRVILTETLMAIQTVIQKVILMDSLTVIPTDSQKH